MQIFKNERSEKKALSLIQGAIWTRVAQKLLKLSMSNIHGSTGPVLYCIVYLSLKTDVKAKVKKYIFIYKSRPKIARYR